MVQINAEAPETPKFVSDRTLGKLTRYLRFAGFDSEFILTGEEIISLAKRETRILLTRDRSLFTRCCLEQDLEVHFPESDQTKKQFIDVCSRYNLWIWRTLKSRCMKCNGVLDVAKRDDVVATVPDYVLTEVDRFLQCRICRNIVWRGSHTMQLKTSMNTWMDQAHQAP